MNRQRDAWDTINLNICFGISFDVMKDNGKSHHSGALHNSAVT